MFKGVKAREGEGGDRMYLAVSEKPHHASAKRVTDFGGPGARRSSDLPVSGLQAR